LLGARLLPQVAPPNPRSNHDGGANQRVPADQQARRHDAPQDEQNESAIHQVRRQHRRRGGIDEPQQLRTNPVVLGMDVRDFSKDPAQAGGWIVACWRNFLLPTGCFIPKHRLNPVF
jgi:hypothetical protein